MAIDYRLANEVLNRRPDYSLGDRIVQGGKIIRDSFDRTRELDRRAEMDRIGAFISDEISTGEPSENAIIAEVAKTMPAKAMTMYNNLQNRYQQEDQGLLDYEIEMAKLKQQNTVNPLFEKAASNQLQAKNIYNSIGDLEKEEYSPNLGIDEETYNQQKQTKINDLLNRYREYAQGFAKTSAALAGTKGGKQFIDEYRIPSYEAKRQKQADEKRDRTEKDLKINIARTGIKQEDRKFLTNRLDAYNQQANKNGLNLEVARKNKGILDKVYSLAMGKFTIDPITKEKIYSVQPNSAAVHAVNLIANKALDPESAVLLSEAASFEGQKLINQLEKFKSYSTSKTYTLPTPDTYKTAKSVLESTYNDAKIFAENTLKNINLNLSKERGGSGIKITREEIGLGGPDLFAKEKAAKEEKIIKTLTPAQIRQMNPKK